MAIQTVLITAPKGGSGASSVTAHLSSALARRGHRVLAVDLCVTSRSLDLLYSLSESTIYDFADILSQKIAPDRALLEIDGFRPPKCRPRQTANRGALYLLPGVFRIKREPTAPEIRRTVQTAAEAAGCDMIVIDGEWSVLAGRAARIADKTVIVTDLTRASLRAAEEAATALAFAEPSLIINAAPIYPKQKPKAFPNMIELLNTLHTQLDGIVPAELAAAEDDENGNAAYPRKTNHTRAFDNIAARLDGQNCPIFSGFRKIKRKLYLKQMI